ncbi:hypothetical protein [Paenibacillus sp. J2TS4]|uniref:hypothetical protein n=1 Tax=Paenibacillus sp. J2TS4 TaxID=2807194 RepID=UPI001BCBA6EE|nr:hypothetical protein [Paenibacillus sp. J2TS4]
MILQIFGAILQPVIKAACKQESHDDSYFRVSASIEEQIDLFLDHYFSSVHSSYE